MRQNFPLPALTWTLNYEGGWSDNPHDPGGVTYHGVTQKVYTSYRMHKGLAGVPVRLMTVDEEDEIYKIQYWQAVRGDELYGGLDASVFDCAVNSGPVEAIILLQRALGVKADGYLGIITMGAVQTKNNKLQLIADYNKLRLGFLHRLRNWLFFRKGWTARVKDIDVKSKLLFSKGQSHA